MKIMNLLSKRDQKSVAFVRLLLNDSKITKSELCDRLNCTMRALDTLIKNIKQDSFFSQSNVSIETAHQQVILKHPNEFTTVSVIAHYLKRSTKYQILNFVFNDRTFLLPECSQLFISKTEYYRQTKELNQILQSLQLHIRKGRLEGPDCQKAVLFYELYSLVKKTDSNSIVQARYVLQKFKEPLRDDKAIQLGVYIYVLNRLSHRKFEQSQTKFIRIPWQKPISAYLTVLENVVKIDDKAKRQKICDMLFVFIVSQIASASGELIKIWDEFVKESIPNLYQGVQWWEQQLLGEFNLTPKMEYSFLRINTFYYFNPGGVFPTTLRCFDIENDQMIHQVVQILKERLSISNLHIRDLNSSSKQILIFLYVRILLKLYPKSQLNITVGLFAEPAYELTKYVQATVELFTKNKVQVKKITSPTDVKDIDLVITDYHDWKKFGNRIPHILFNGSYSDLSDLPQTLNQLALKKYVGILAHHH